MENFVIAGEDRPIFTPEIILDASTGQCSIKGESYLEEPFQLYDSILDWMTHFLSSEGQTAELTLELTYINSTSSRAILDLFRGLSALKKEGKSIKANWRYPKGEDGFNEVKEEGEEFMDESGLEMTFIAY